MCDRFASGTAFRVERSAALYLVLGVAAVVVEA